MAGVVEVNGIVVTKPGHNFSILSEIKIKQSTLPYVSRGGLKLEAALDYFSIDVNGLVLMDVGASTGGFSDCLLQRGAANIIAVDVGYGQYHWKLRQDKRVTLLEKTNARYLKKQDIEKYVNGAVIDVSFISLKLIIPPIFYFLLEHSFIVALIKPQFEVGKDQVGKGGVVRDPELHSSVTESIAAFCESTGWEVAGCIESPIKGPKGNKEFLVYMKK